MCKVIKYLIHNLTRSVLNAVRNARDQLLNIFDNASPGSSKKLSDREQWYYGLRISEVLKVTFCMPWFDIDLAEIECQIFISDKMDDSPRSLLVSPATSDVSGKKSSKCCAVCILIAITEFFKLFCKEVSLGKIWIFKASTDQTCVNVISLSNRQNVALTCDVVINLCRSWWT